VSGRIRRILHPAWYQSHARRPPFFEGWYYKVVDAAEANRYAIIPGVFMGRTAAESHCFVQVLDGNAGIATYHAYPVSEFWAADDRLEIRVGPNRFTLDSIRLDIADDQRAVAGDLGFEGLLAWPVTWISPGAMGWFAWVPAMQCYHGVLGFDHAIEGALRVDGREIDFGGGRGYIEKDWGRAFPSAYVWMQSNHLDLPRTSVTISVAHIPWLAWSFRGFIAGFLWEGQLFRLATYTGARIERLDVGERHVELVLRDARHRLVVTARRTPAGVLKGPSGADMGVRVPETLRGEMDVQFWERAGGGGVLLFEGTGRNAAIEVVGEL
jgi:hypothetical protein